MGLQLAVLDEGPHSGPCLTTPHDSPFTIHYRPCSRGSKAVLAFDHIAVEAVVAHQLGMRSDFHDPAFVEHHDDVGVGDGAEAMGDDERRAGGE